MQTFEYNRRAAVAYAVKWAYFRNPKYMEFDELGGDCTNFASQCVYAGSGVMNYTPVYGWYYIDPQNRTASWTGVEYFYNFMTTNEGVGPFGKDADISEVRPGDIAQLGTDEGSFYHSLVITQISGEPSYDTIRVSAHNNDALLGPLSTYSFAAIRFIHILGVRTE